MGQRFQKNTGFGISGNMHIYKVLNAYRVSLIPCSSYRGVVLTNYSLLYSIYGQNSKFKGVEIPRKIKEPEFSRNKHIYILSPLYIQSFTKFCAVV